MMQGQAELVTARPAQGTPSSSTGLHAPVLVLCWRPPDPDLVNVLKLHREPGPASQPGRLCPLWGPFGLGSASLQTHLVLALPPGRHGGGTATENLFSTVYTSYEAAPPPKWELCVRGRSSGGSRIAVYWRQQLAECSGDVGECFERHKQQRIVITVAGGLGLASIIMG